MNRAFAVLLFLMAFLPLARAQWAVDLNIHNAGLNDIAAADFFQVIAVGSDRINSFSDGQAFRSIDGGLTWDSTSFSAPGESRNLYRTAWADAQTVYASTFEPTLYKSVDAGATWDTLMLPDGPGTALELMHWMNADTGLVGNWEGPIYRTTTGGVAWTPVLSTGFAMPFLHLDCPSANTCYVHAIGATDFYKSTDGGQTWNPLSGAPSGFFVGGFDALNEDTLILMGFAEAARSEDGGASWTYHPMPSSGTYTDVEFVGAFGIAVGDGSNIAQSTDFGTTWTSAYSDPASGDTLTAVHVLNDSTAWACSKHGSIYRLGAPPPPPPPPTALPSTPLQALRIGPNPNHGLFQAHNTSLAPAVLRIYNALGQLMQEHAFASGESKALNLKDAGWYWCQWRQDDQAPLGQAVLVQP